MATAHWSTREATTARTSSGGAGGSGQLATRWPRGATRGVITTTIRTRVSTTENAFTTLRWFGGAAPAWAALRSPATTATLSFPATIILTAMSLARDRSEMNKFFHSNSI